MRIKIGGEYLSNAIHIEIQKEKRGRKKEQETTVNNFINGKIKLFSFFFFFNSLYVF